MKSIAWVLLGLALAGTAFAQADTNPAPAAAASGLRPGPAVVQADSVIVRGQPGLRGERLALLRKGDQVRVFEEIVLDKPARGEPDRWARIALPEGVKVWIHSLFIDVTNKTVRASRLNLRAGPGENFSVLGLLERGETFVETGVMEGDWIQIEPPTNAYAFVASRFLRQEAGEAPAPTPTPPAASTNVPPTPETTTPVTVAEPPVLAGPPTEPETEPAPTFTEPPPPGVGADPAALEKAREAMRQKMAELIAQDEAARAAAAARELPEVRVVTREGRVRRTFSIQAPSRYALVDLETGRTMNYLYTTATNLDLSRYIGLTIRVTGEEGLDPRWKATPVLTIRRIQVLE
ncbi:SH3 domain-containing protein [Limisphaera sp. VF-2]|jgi:uncharacterized protein YgiM (DUF1202 family)|uniref:SH3 domain-containing protein n=1 Tax=Limisphaera sp. VF-2 TaxID=3400418 RepID=UPI001775DD43|nr:hypothetical protein [Limisphaera sp.]